MSQNLPAARWIYRGLWRLLVDWFCVPTEPPTLPHREELTTMRPSEGYLRYLKTIFWILVWWPDIGILVGWLALSAVMPVLGMFLALPALAIAVVPDVIAYVAIHLKYDTTWYVLSDRSIRIRRGVWVIRESTITFENIQNVVLSQGPLQRYFGIANVVIETAGGGGGAGRPGHGGESNLHTGVIEGVTNAAQIREQIMDRVRASRTAGLGDERPGAHEHAAAGALPAWTAAHLEALREIRDGLAVMTA